MEESAKKVLVFVSSKSISSFVCNILRRSGFDVEQLRTYKDLLEKSRSSNVGIIVLSDMIAGRDGYECASTIKNFDANNTKSIIVMNINVRRTQSSTLEERMIYSLDVPFRDEGLKELLQKIYKRRSHAAKKKKVLFYAPLKRQKKAIEEVLSDYELQMRFVKNVKTLYQEIEEYEPDLLILDIDLKRKYLYEQCSRVRSDSKFYKLPIIMLTKRELAKERFCGFKYGAADYFPKPLDGKKLFDYISLLLDNLSSPGTNFVLVVSKLPITGYILSYLLEKNRFSCLHVTSNEEALSVLKNRKKVDALITDTQTDKQRAIELIRSVKSNVKYEGVPTIAIVSDETSDILESDASLELSDYLITPFDEARFIRRVKNNLIFKNVIDNLEYQNKQLVNVEKKRSEIITFASYNIKGPISLIRNYSLFCIRNELDRWALTDVMKKVYRQAKLAGDIVDTTMSFESINAGKYTLEKSDCDLVMLVSDILDDNRLFFEKKGLEVNMNVNDAIPGVKIDRLRVYEALNNLLLNSVRISHEGENISVNISMLEYDDDFYSIFDSFSSGGSSKKLGKFVEIRLIDSGRTLNESIRKRIFNPLLKSEGSREEHNINLGLHIARQIITMHNGKIWVENEGEGDKGNAFIVLLPV